MSDGRKIYCVCGKYMGEIRDASLRKEIFYLCSDCNTKRKAAEMAMKFRQPSNPVEDILGGIFGKSGGR